nr:hypothetical protein [Tanacetum cinerariifolium]
MQMVGGNVKNQFRQYAGQNVGNLNGYNTVQNVENQVVQNAVQNPRVQNIGNQNGLIGVLGYANQNQNGNSNLVAAHAEGNAAGHNGNQIRCYNCRGKEEVGIQLQAEEFDLMAAAADLDEIKEVNANCILMANLQQASTSGTQTDKAPVYDSDGSAEVHDYENCYNNEIFNMFTQEEQYTELLEPIPKPHQVPQNDNDVIFKVTSVEQSRATVEQHPANLEKTRALYDSLYQNLEIEVDKFNSVNRKLKETNVDLTTELARFKNQEKCFEIVKKNMTNLKDVINSLFIKNNPEWSRHVTIVHQTKDLHTADYTQLISSNPRNRQIAQPGMNMGQDRQMQMVGGNGENLFRQYAGQNVGNLNGYNAVQNVRNQVSQNPRFQNVRNQNRLIGVPGNANLNGNGNLVAELNNILVKMGQSIQTTHMLLPKPDSFYHTEQKMALGYQNPFYLMQAQKKQQNLYDGKVLLEKHDPPVVHDFEKTLQLAQESHEKMKQLNKEIKPVNYTKINHLSGVFVSQTAKSRKELYFSNDSKTANVSKSISIPNEEFSDDTTPSVACKFLNEVKSTIVNLQRVLKHRMTLETHNWSSSAHQELYKIVNFSQDIMYVVQKTFVVDTSNLQTELERTKEHFENCIIKKENEYAKLCNDWYKKCDE